MLPLEGDQEYQGAQESGRCRKELMLSRVGGVGKEQELMLSCLGGPVRCREGPGAAAVLRRRSGGAGGA